MVVPFHLCHLPLFIMRMAHFSRPNSIPMSWVCIRVSNSFSFLVNSLMSSMYIRWFIFSGDLVSLYPAMHFLSMWLSVIMPIITVMLIVHLLGIYLFGSLLQLSFSLLLSILLSRFSSCSHWGCADQYRVVLLCFWILCSKLSVPQGTIYSLLARNKSLPLFVPLVFSTS